MASVRGMDTYLPRTEADFAEIPVGDLRLRLLLESRGGDATDLASEAWWSAPDVQDRLRPHIDRVARSTLTDVQYYYFSGYVLEGRSQAEIAAARGVSQATVSQAIYGRVKHGKPEGAAVGKMVEALKTDQGFQAEVRSIQDAQKPAPEPDRYLYSRWWAGHTSPAHADWFVPLGVLLVAHTLRDSKNQVPFNDLLKHLPRAVVDNSIRRLRVGTYIDFDGVNITIKKIPVEASNA